MPKEPAKKITKKAPARPARGKKKTAKKSPVKSEVQLRTRKTRKKPVPPTAAEPKKKVAVAGKYIEAKGRRKTAVARVRFWTKGQKEFLVNDKNYQDYFPNFELQKVILAPLEMINSEGKFKISVKVKGSGVCSQAGAVRHGLSRALIKFNPDFRKQLKKAGFLTRDPRMRERKKFGLKRARRGPQWSKR